MSDDALAVHAADREAINASLISLVEETRSFFAPRVGEAIGYILSGEGKRVRGFLVLLAYRACGGDRSAYRLAAAVEVVHAYSLVHDDLPCMDDDDVRRGRPTAHRAFDVPLATTAGLSMVPMAARAAFHGALELGLSIDEGGAIVRELMRASGATGMIGGQLLDLDAEGCALSLIEMERIHRLKTGSLIEAAVRIGGRAARASAEQLDALTQYGASIGLAFQIADDVLDVTSTTTELGKTVGRDLTLRKSTYPSLLGIEGARERAEALVESGCTALQAAGIHSLPLETLARYVIQRRS